MKPTQIFAGLALCLIAALVNNVAMAAQVLVQKFYFDGETCDGTPNFVLSGVINQCREMGTMSMLYTCSSYKTFRNQNCAGEPDSEGPFAVGCQGGPGVLPSLTSCETFPDEDIYLIRTGDACTEDGEVEGELISQFIVLNFCFPGSTTSFMYTLTGEGNSTLTTTYYEEVSECTTPSHTETLEVGTCVVTYEPEYEGEAQVVKKVSLGVFPTSAPTTEPPTAEPPATESPTPEDDNNNPGNGSDAMAGAAINIAALIATMTGVLMAIHI